MFTREQYLMGRDKEYPLTPELEKNLTTLMEKVAALEEEMPEDMWLKVSSGYRPGRYNVAAGGAPKSAHLTAEAVDIQDPTGAIDEWCAAHLDILAHLGLCLENPRKTVGWTHLDLKKRYDKNGNRIWMFLP